MTQRDRSQLVRDLKAAFPQITSELNAERERLHFEVEVFRRLAQRAIFDGDRDLAAKCFSLAAAYLTEGNSEVRDAIGVFFVEPIEFGSPPNEPRWAWDALPDVLKNAYVEFQETRVRVAAERVVKNLTRGFGHSEEEARSLFAAFHTYYSANGGWSPADYYDHETPAAIALEIQFHHQFPDLSRHGMEFLDWRKKQWTRVSNLP
jgi:hypothetical protein